MALSKPCADLGIVVPSPSLRWSGLWNSHFITILSGFLCSRQRVRKNHGEKKNLILVIKFGFSTENDVSEQTLESYKSRSNEDSPGHEKNGQGKKL